MSGEVVASKLKRKRLAWSKASEEVLLDLWPGRLEELRGQRKKSHIYAEMADELSKLGFSYSSRDVHVKLQNFTQRYRKEKEAMGVSGSPSTWSQYEKVHQIIGGFKANLFTEFKLESINDSSTSSSLPSPCRPLTESSSPLPPVSSAPAETGTSASSTEPAKKKRKLENFQKLSNDISEHLNKSSKLKRKRLAWSKASEEVLLDLWPGRLKELCGQRKKGHIYAEMADELSKLGFSYSSRDVHVKLQNFTQRYRKEKAAMGVSGGSPSTWSQYGRVHKIIGGFKSNLFTELKLESIDDSSTSSSLPSPCTPLTKPTSPLPPVSPVPGETGTSSTEPAKKKRKLEMFEKLSIDISEHLKKCEENERELIAIEKRKADSLDCIAKALISFLNKK